MQYESCVALELYRHSFCGVGAALLACSIIIVVAILNPALSHAQVTVIMLQQPRLLNDGHHLSIRKYKSLWRNHIIPLRTIGAQGFVDLPLRQNALM